MNKCLSVILFLATIISSNKASSQKPDYSFLDHLITIKDYHSAILETQTLLQSQHTNKLLFYRAIIEEKANGLSKSLSWYKQITTDFPLSDSLHLKNTIKLIATDSLNLAFNYLRNIKLSKDKSLQIQQFQMQSINILLAKETEMKQKAQVFNYPDFKLEFLNTQAQKTYKSLIFKQKSKFLAGILSAAIPGSGKIYAGKPHEGLTSLLMCGSLAAISIENYKKNGIRNPKTIAFASIFSIFYAGNIYGSIVAAKRKKHETQHDNSNKIKLVLGLTFDHYFH